jgi:group II intron reverse transcriptase/maturase
LVEENSEAKDEAMVPMEEIATPTKVQQLQRTLYRKAKENGRWRAWSLYGDLCRRDVLATALAAVVGNAGAAGVDGVTTEQVKTGSAAFLDELQGQLKSKSYRSSPVLRIWIPKGDGKERPLGIPTVKDRVVQAALVLLLQPIFEADFDEGSFGYRPGRDAHQAMDAIREAVWRGRYEIIDADLSDYFGSIPHSALLRLVARRVSDGSVLGLVKAFLKAPIVEEQSGRRIITPNKRGTPQGGPLSPLASNVYLNSLDHGVNDRPELDAKLVRYADDFVLLCRPGRGAALYQRLKVYLQRKGLTLNERKTRVLDVRRESFRFLGFEVSWRQSRCTGKSFPHVAPSKKAQQQLRDAVRQELNHWTTWRSCKAAITMVNRTVRGWSHYFHYGHCTRVFARMQNWLRQRCRTWLWKKYDRTLGRYTFFTNERLQGQYSLFALPSHAPHSR